MWLNKVSHTDKLRPDWYSHACARMHARMCTHTHPQPPPTHTHIMHVFIQPKYGIIFILGFNLFMWVYRGFKPEANGPPAGIYVWGVMNGVMVCYCDV